MLERAALPLIIILFLLAVNVSAYQVTYYTQNETINPFQTTGVSVFWDQNCDSIIILNSTAGSSGSYVLTHEFFSPDETLVATSIKSRSANITCQQQNVDTSGGISLNGFYESKVTTTFDAQDLKNYFTVIYDCDANADELFLYNETFREDSYGNHPFGYGESFGTCFQQSPSQCTNDLTGDLTNVVNYIKASSYYSDCGGDLRQDRDGEEYHVGSCGGIQSDIDMNYWIVVPFTAGPSGITNISVNDRDGYRFNPAAGGTLQYANQYYLYDTVIDSSQNMGTTFPFSTDLNLIPNRDYWLLVGTRYFIDNHNCGSGNDWGVVHNWTDYTISIFAYEPDYVCGEWSECVDNLQTRSCVDANGRVPDIIEEQSCFDVPPVDIDLGFENFFNQEVWICQKNYWLITCVDRLDSITAKYPVNWSVVATEEAGKNLENFITISQDWKSKGSSSLKMWYYPPKDEEPLKPGPICGNNTGGRSSEITLPYNESIFVQRNVSFASPFIQLRFDVKKCNSPPIQYGYIDYGCGTKCYANNCSETPRGRYGIRITTLNGGQQFVDTNFSLYDTAAADITNDALNFDAVYGSISAAGTGTINSTNSNAFINGTMLVFNGIYGTNPGRWLCFDDGVTQIADPIQLIAAPGENLTRTLYNIGTALDSVFINPCNLTGFTTNIDQLRVLVLANVTVQDVVFDFFDEATLATQNKILDLSNADIEVGRNYTLSIAVNPENQFDPFSHCLYIDDFSVTFTEVALPECVSRCDGLTYYQAVELEDGVCKFTITETSSNCIDNDDIQDAIDNNEDFTLGNQTYIWNNETGSYDIIDSPPTVTIPDETTEVVPAQDLLTEIFELMSTRLFWALAWTFIVFILVLITTARLGTPSFQGAMGAAIITIGIFAGFGWIPVEITAMIVLLLALIIVYEFRKAT
jgi:hypothetical protein